jgi:hypothetical protein
MEAALPTGEATLMEFAMLSDRIAVLGGRPQIYGTQFDWDDQGLMSPEPIADPARVDALRAQAGLPPLHQKIAEITAATREERPPADLARRRAEKNAWAKRVGWRS